MSSKNTDWQRYAIIAKRAQERELPAPIPTLFKIADIIYPLCALRALGRQTVGEFSSDFQDEAELRNAKMVELCAATIRTLALTKSEGESSVCVELTPQAYTRIAKNLRVQITDNNSSIWEEAVLRLSAHFTLTGIERGANLLGIIVLIGMYADENKIDLHDMLGEWASTLKWDDDE